MNKKIKYFLLISITILLSIQTQAQTRLRIGKQLEKSITPGSIVKTNALNEQEYVPPGTEGTYLKVVGGVPMWVTETNSDSQSIYLSNDTLYITRGNFAIIPKIDTISLSNRIDAKQDTQSLSLSNDTLFISRGNSVILNNDRQRTITTNTTLTNDYDGKIILIKGTCTITIPTGLRNEFNCVFRTFSGFVGTFVAGAGATIDAPKGLILRNFSMSTLFKDGATNNYILEGDLIFN